MTPSNLRSISRQLYAEPAKTFADSKPMVRPSNHIGQYDRIQCAPAMTPKEQAAQRYSPAQPSLQRAFIYGWENGCSAPGMSFYERTAAICGSAEEIEQRMGPASDETPVIEPLFP